MIRTQNFFRLSNNFDHKIPTGDANESNETNENDRRGNKNGNFDKTNDVSVFLYC